MSLFISLLCIIAGILLLLQFAPQVHLEIFIHENERREDFLPATISIHNTSRSRLTKQTILLQNLAYDSDKMARLPDSVPFKTSSVRSGEEPMDWHEPRELYKDLIHLFPGESLTTEVLIPCPKDAAAVHVGLQFNSAPGALENLIGRFFTLKSCWETGAYYLTSRD